MFDRAEYKRIAKLQLKGRFTAPLLATLCIMAVMIIFSAPQIFEYITSVIAQIQNRGGQMDIPKIQSYAPATDITGIAFLGICGILTLAYTKLFLEMWKTRDSVPFSSFLAAFTMWLKGVLSMLWMYLWVFLWSLLFFIPGIVKAYAYSQMFFIVAENPKIGVRKAMKLSIEITKGYKGELFIMDLSFLGWMLLSSLSGGLLYLYVMPYMQMSKTNAYKMLKAIALRSGRVRPEDFGMEQQETNAGSGQEQENQGAYYGSSGTEARPTEQKTAGDSSGMKYPEAHEAAPDTNNVITLPPPDEDSTH